MGCNTLPCDVLHCILSARDVDQSDLECTFFFRACPTGGQQLQPDQDAGQRGAEAVLPPRVPQSSGASRLVVLGPRKFGACVAWGSLHTEKPACCYMFADHVNDPVCFDGGKRAEADQ